MLYFTLQERRKETFFVKKRLYRSKTDKKLCGDKSYMARPLKPFGEWDWEVREAVKTALALVEGKNGFKTHSEIWRRCNLVITVGHNIYTTKGLSGRAM